MSRASSQLDLVWVGSKAHDDLFKSKERPDGTMQPPAMIRSPTVKAGLLQIQPQKDIGDPARSFQEMCTAFKLDSKEWSSGWTWLEIYCVIKHEKHFGWKLYFFRPECMFTGFRMKETLGFIKIPDIVNCSVQTNMMLIEMQTDRGTLYRFRCTQPGEVDKWQKAVMLGTPNNALVEDQETNESEWGYVLEENQKANGGLRSALSKPHNKLEQDEDQVLRELFNNIMNCNSANGEKRMENPDDLTRLIPANFIESADVMKWCSNRFSLVKDPAKQDALAAVVNGPNIEKAMAECSTFDRDGPGTVVYEVFREAMCKPSAIIRKIVLAMLDTFAKLERYIYLEAISETEMLSEVDYVVMYHKHLTQVQAACRTAMKIDQDTSESFIDNRDSSVRGFLRSIKEEVTDLKNKLADEQRKLRAFNPSLRSRNQDAIDETFSANSLAGKRWDSCSPLKSWAK